MKIYRGHKHEDFRKTNHQGLHFTENRDLAFSYGEGKNDVGNLDLKNGHLTAADFVGKIGRSDLIGLDYSNSLPIVGVDAVRCRDGVIVVYKESKLSNVNTEKLV